MTAATDIYWALIHLRHHAEHFTFTCITSLAPDSHFTGKTEAESLATRPRSQKWRGRTGMWTHAVSAQSLYSWPPRCTVLVATLPQMLSRALTAPLPQSGQPLLCPSPWLRPYLSCGTCCTGCPDLHPRGCSRRHEHHLASGFLSPLMVLNHTLGCHHDAPRATPLCLPNVLPGHSKPPRSGSASSSAPSLEEPHQPACHTHISSVLTTVQRPPSLSPGVPPRLLSPVPNPWSTSWMVDARFQSPPPRPAGTALPF